MSSGTQPTQPYDEFSHTRLSGSDAMTRATCHSRALRSTDHVCFKQRPTIVVVCTPLVEVAVRPHPNGSMGGLARVVTSFGQTLCTGCGVEQCAVRYGTGRLESRSYARSYTAPSHMSMSKILPPVLNSSSPLTPQVSLPTEHVLVAPVTMPPALTVSTADEATDNVGAKSLVTAVSPGSAGSSPQGAMPSARARWAKAKSAVSRQNNILSMFKT